ncbi:MULTISPECIES: BofC C-terminal domain-containing protein [Bacillaceae]|jgi:forespore regulator of the sigma-K checkpoint|uniref:BofC C-terminal domain-containing protein n=1 Tax=Bacillaceae TaxID=186817 RepID=UPI0004E0FF3D|nr:MULTISPECIES: BofC C-terminal domain-containing protein [Bacillaceae]MCF2646689.1 BofC C-terminal domain-containing protein [Niallia circulans]MCM3360735.1 intercompartmental signaling factor BofC [Niallia sp. MER TA 168]CAI9396870.1 Protein BofC [Bacillus sp. T2.9-1]
MKTRFLLFSAVLLVSFITIISSTGQVYGKSGSTHSLNENPKKLEVVLKRIYLDGEVSEEVVEETVWSMEDFWSKYDKWQLVDMTSKELVFKQEIDDISPLLKANGYFGINDEGILTIYNGKPAQENIIQSFFQIDLKKLESKQQEDLQKGIPIKSRDRYVKVLETFKNLTTIETTN